MKIKMKKNKILTFILLCNLFIINTQLKAQFEEDSLFNAFKKDTNLIDLSPAKYPIFLDLGLSANAYNGDLSSYQKWTAMYHFGISFNKNEKWNGRINLSFGFITGENRTYQSSKPNEQGAPVTFFSTSLVNFNYELKYHFIKTKRWAIYASQGIGVMQFTPKNEDNQKLINLLNTRAADESYNNIAVFFPTSLGVNYWLKSGYGIGLQGTILNPQTNYLDNIGVLGTRNKNDQVLQFRFFVLAPLRIINPKKIMNFKKRNNYTNEKE